jgi:steroid 5-alpha reductase family enzyme
MPLSPLNAFLVSVAVVVAAKTFAWLLQLKTKNGGLVDAVWAITLGGLAALYALTGSAPAETRAVLGVMGLVWGLRLGWHLWERNWGKPEDFRYAKFREQWGESVNFKMFWFFQFQNIFTLMLSASAFIPVAYRPDATPLWAVALAVALWFISVAGEAVADTQMERFRKNPANKGKVCRDGLWRYSRHPNYFFECVHWLAYVALAIGSPWWWATLAAPLVMAFLLVKLSGMPMLEKDMIARKPCYADYVRTTSALIPWPPKA